MMENIKPCKVIAESPKGKEKILYGKNLIVVADGNSINVMEYESECTRPLGVASFPATWVVYREDVLRQLEYVPDQL